MGVEHIQNILALDHATVTAIADPHEQSRDWAQVAVALDTPLTTFGDHRDLLESGLVDAVVEDRLVHEDVEVQAVVESDIETDSCCGPNREDIEGIGAALAGKVWSVLVTARRP